MAPDTSFWPNGRWLERFRRLYLRSATRSILWAEGRRPGIRPGSSVEIADFRPYSQGDDIRYIDWNAYARFDQVIVRLFQARRALPVTVFLDASARMDFGRPRKFDFARGLVALLGLLALQHQDQLTLWAMARLTGRPRTFLGVAALGHLKRHLAAMAPHGPMDLVVALTRALAETRRGGRAIIISDFLPAVDLAKPLRLLAAAGQHPLLVHVLAPQERYPEFTGPLWLRDPESLRSRRLTPGRGVLRQYQQRLAEYRRQLATEVRAVGGDYVWACSDWPWERLFAAPALVAAPPR